MNPTDFTYLLNRPDAITDKHTDSLERIVSEFPYFQSARALRLKGLYNQNSFQYNFALKTTAAYTTDRSVLFDFITSDTFTAIHKGLYEQKLAELYGIEVKAIEIVKADKNDGADKLEQSILTSIRESVIPYAESPEISEVEEQVINPEEVAPEEIVPENLLPTQITQPEAETNAESQEMVSEVTEAKLDIGRPLEFSKNETHSFSEWLQLSKFQPIVRENQDHEPTESQDPEKLKKSELIDRFIMASPKIPQIRSDIKPAAAHEPTDNSAIMTETLARVYLEQKKYQKAIQAYEILILKYPEKSIFFADRISDIKKLQQNNI